jgi:methylphosphotriester-DNA--protein-cysteine methyltransferase
VEAGLRERILEAATPVARCKVMEAVLLERARGKLELRTDIDAAIRKFEANCRPEQFLTRRFTERFRGTVGLTPKTFARVRRFQTALRKIARGGDPDWSDIALSCGYYDQAHFNHDFRAFSGINPGTYVAKRTPHLNHVPL